MKTIHKIIVAVAVMLGFATSLQAQQNRREALRDSILAQITGAKIQDSRYDVTRFGARGDGKRDCLPAFKKAIKAVSRKGGGTVVVPAGTYLLRGPLTLVSNLCIEVSEGATIKFDPDPNLYPTVATSWEGTFLYNYSPMIYGHGLQNVAITGKGTIDGNATTTFATWRSKQKPDQKLSRKMNHEETPVEQRIFGKGHYLRPHLIQFYDCKGVTVEGIKMINSPFWCLHLLKSENIICRSIRYDAKLVNNDGIDPECSRNILIEDVNFDNGDDNIAIKSGRDNDGWCLGSPSENIVIRNCHFKGLHAVVIGSEMSGGVRNVIIEDCDYAGYCKRGIYVKTNPDRGGFVENIYVSNCQLGQVEDLLYVTSQYAGEGLDNTHYSEVCGIYVDGLRCQSASGAAIVLQGTIANPLEDIVLNNIEVANGKAAVSFEHVKAVEMGDCNIGGKAGTPTQVTEKDNLFGRDK